MFALIFSSCQTSLGPRTTTSRRRGADKTALFSYVWVSNCGGCPEPVWANLPFRISACPEPVWTKSLLLIYNLETHTNAHAVYYRVVSGRPWHYDGDNPAPYIDPVRDHQIKVLNLLFFGPELVWVKTDLNETTRVRMILRITRPPAYNNAIMQ
jgi:hypothetical protein